MKKEKSYKTVQWTSGGFCSSSIHFPFFYEQALFFLLKKLLHPIWNQRVRE